jgi:Peptidase_C39 like family
MRRALPAAGLLAVTLLGAVGAWSLQRRNERAAPAPAAGASGYPSVVIAGVPHVRQKPDFCGEADVEMYLRFRGKAMTQDQVFGLADVAPELGRGAVTRELKTAMQKLGFDVGPVWNDLASDGGIDRLFSELVADLGRQVPSIVCMKSDESRSATEHFRLVLGYDASTDEVVYHEPAEHDGAYRRMPRARFLRTWPLGGGGKSVAIRLRLDAREIRVPAPEPGFSRADFAQHVMALRPKVPSGYTLVVEPPFIVIGNAEPARVERAAERIVRWAVVGLKRDFFVRDPLRIIDIWLLKDKASYRDEAFDLSGYYPDTPYGYYDAPRSQMIMNIATGGGTLVHEIVHPFVEANVPDCPAWFNEGLGSLFEQTEDQDGHIVGLTNWRLPALQQAIRAHRLPSFSDVCHTTEDEFYRGRYDNNYAQSRYLLYYLQERGLLTRYTREMLAARRTDPSGYDTLVKVLGETDMAAFQNRWEQYVLGLEFRR